MVEPVSDHELDAIIEIEDEYRRRRKRSSYTPTRDYRMAWELRELRRGNPVDAALETAGEELGHVEAANEELQDAIAAALTDLRALRKKLPDEHPSLEAAIYNLIHALEPAGDD